MKMVVGLGNPGRRYSATRHNIGFDVIGQLAQRHHAGATRQRFQAETAEIRLDQEKVLLLSPLTFMNCSGNSVQPARDFFRLENQDILIVCDDFQLPLGQLRFRTRGSDGGQKGLADVLRRLGSQEVSRLRIGIGPLPDNWDVADFVLSKLSPADRTLADAAVCRAADAVADWVARGTAYCMNHYNAKANKPKANKPKDKPIKKDAAPTPASQAPADDSSAASQPEAAAKRDTSKTDVAAPDSTATDVNPTSRSSSDNG